jgi:hypothetical protein
MEQEEPKQIKCYCGHTITCDCGPLEEPKQETLEEAAEKYVKSDLKKTPLYGMFNDTFIAGAKWQAERMYSEEEVKEAYWNRTDDIDVDGYWISDPEKDLEMLIEQFKKQ